MLGKVYSWTENLGDGTKKTFYYHSYDGKKFFVTEQYPPQEPPWYASEDEPYYPVDDMLPHKSKMKLVYRPVIINVFKTNKGA